MTTCFNSIKHKLINGHGYFDLLGFDFMLDREFNVSFVLTVAEVIQIIMCLH